MGKAWVGAPVHYRSYGTPGGEYPQACRAATITELFTDAVEQRDEQRVGLAVLNPTGLFFDGSVRYAPLRDQLGGTWHWRTEGCT